MLILLPKLAHLANPWFDAGKDQGLTKDPLGWLDGQCVQGAGTYSPLDFTHISYIFFPAGFLKKAVASRKKGA